MNKLKFFKLKEQAELPSLATDGSVGYDLTCIELLKVTNDVVFLGTGLAVVPPEGYHTELVPRSSISKFVIEQGNFKIGLQMANSFGLVDSDYRGDLIFAFRLTGDFSRLDELSRNLVISKIKTQLPAKLGQLIVRKSELPEVEEIFELPTTVRGAGGFGSTDAK
jgi:dUTP pyrophosphatase